MFNGAIALYCYQHIKDVLIPTAFYSRKDGLTDTRVPFEGAHSLYCTRRGD